VLFAPASGSRPGVGLATYASDRTGGFVGGAQVGYNYQFYKHFVLGVETDAQWSGITGQHQSNAVERPYSVVSLDSRVGLDWFGTTRVRAGFARGDSLSYVSAGVAYGQVSLSGVDYAGGAFSSGLSAVRAGWSIGTGTEYAITSDLALRADYLYLSMGGVSGSTSGVLADLAPVAGSFSSTRVTNSVMRVGLNWKIGSQLFASPVAGR
jgi:outer membrane immunogenic protein